MGLWRRCAMGRPRCTRRRLDSGVGHSATVDTLLAHGADAKACCGGSTPLHYAAQNGHTAIVDALLKAGADGTAKDKEGKSPADWAKQASTR